jgi:chemotaxis protein CheD
MSLALDCAPPVTSCFLHPGGVAIGLRGERFETLLGSCVAIILSDPRRTVGAICHLVHASPAPLSNPDCTTYGEPALAWMFQALRGQGIEPRLCDAHVYGGGNMFPWLGGGPQVGDRNVAWALDILRQHGVPVRVQDTGGAVYRRLGWTVGLDEPEVTTVDV